ncbi:MAG: autotransporter domain-containing protein [Planctomycetota bacterium]
MKTVFDLHRLLIRGMPMYTKILALVAGLLLCGFAQANQAYAAQIDGTLVPIPTPTSSGSAFCSANPNTIFALQAIVTDQAPSAPESAGSLNLPVQIRVLTYCENRLNPRVRVIFTTTGGTATSGTDYQGPGSPTMVQASVTQFATDVDSNVAPFPITIFDDTAIEPTETVEIGYLEVRYIYSNASGPDTNQIFTFSPLPPEIVLSIIDNDGAPADADLAISQTHTAANPLVVGSTFQKSLTVTNNGPAAASSITVSDTLPPQLTFVGSDCGAFANGQDVNYSIGSLANGASNTCVLTLRVASPGPVSNTASITSSTPADPDTSNNTTTATIGTAIANQPPVTSTCSATSANGQPVTFDLLPCASDPEGGPLTFTAGAQPPPNQGSFTVSGNFATFTPAAGFVGTVPLPIEVRDDANNVTNLVANVTVTGNATNQPPVATNGSASTTGVTPVTVNLATLATDPENDALIFAIATPPSSSQGTATLSGSLLTFTPARGFEGNAVIGLTVRDPTHPAVAFNVTVAVSNNPGNRPPVGINGTATSSGGAEVAISLAPLFTDPDGDALTFMIATPPANGSARIVGQTAFYVPSANFEGLVQFVVRATDPSGLSATSTITVTVDANLDPEDTEGVIDGALGTLPNGGSEVAQGAVTAVAAACGAAASGSAVLQTCQALIDAAQANNGAVVEDALENLAAEEISAQSNVAGAILTQQKANVAARMASMRGGSSGLDVAGLSIFTGNGALSLGMFGQNLNAAQDDSAAGGVGDLRPSPWGVFVNGSIGGGSRDSMAAESGFDFDNYGVTAGVDYRLNDRAFVGLALGYSASAVDLDQGAGELDTDGLGLTAYYSWYGTNGWYADGSLGYFRNQYDQSRVIDLTSLGLARDVAMSDTDTSQFVATLGVGYEFSRNGWLMTPEFRIEYAGTDIDAFTETGDNNSGFLLAFPEQSFQSLQYSGALQVARAISTTSGILQPFVRVDWYYESDNDGFTLIPRLRSNPNQPFAAIVIDDPDRNFGSLSGGVSWVRPGGTQLYLSVFRTFAYDDLDQWVLRGGLRWEF